jgi:hypothetical protein
LISSGLKTNSSKKKKKPVKKDNDSVNLYKIENDEVDSYELNTIGREMGQKISNARHQ